MSLEDFLQSDNPKIGCVNISKKWDYFYFVPLADNFYGDARFGLEEVVDANAWRNEDKVDHPIFKGVNPTWVNAVTQVLEQHAPNSKLLFVDVGLFVGMVSIHVGKHLHKGRTELICVEPNPSNEVIARLNLELNGLKATIISAACSDAEGEASFWVPKGALISGRLSHSPDRHTHTVKLTQISTIVEDQNPQFDYAVIKVDTEGAEWSVLRGIKADLMEKTLAIIVEYWPTDDLEYERYLLKYFRVFNLRSTMFSAEPPYTEFSTPESLAQIASDGIQKSKNYDILLVPKSGDGDVHRELIRRITCSD